MTGGVLVGARNCAGAVGSFSSPGADDNVVKKTVPELVAIFDVYSCTAYVADDVVAHDRLVRAMDDDAALVAKLESVAMEGTVRAAAKQVEVHAVLSGHPTLSTFLNSCILHAHEASLAHDGV